MRQIIIISVPFHFQQFPTESQSFSPALSLFLTRPLVQMEIRWFHFIAFGIFMANGWMTFARRSVLVYDSRAGAFNRNRVSALSNRNSSLGLGMMADSPCTLFEHKLNRIWHDAIYWFMNFCPRRWCVTSFIGEGAYRGNNQMIAETKNRTDGKRRTWKW